MHKIGDLLKVKHDNIPFIELIDEEFSSTNMLGSTAFNEGDHFRISKIDNEHIYMRNSEGVFYIKEKDFDDFLINIRDLRKEKLEQIFKK